MRIVLVADGRSPTTRSWVKRLAALEHEVTLVSTFPCGPVPGAAADICLPVAFAGLAGGGAGSSGVAGAKRSPARRVVASFRGLFLAGRYRLGPLTLRYYGPRLRWLVERIQPDMVHALRIPFEGMLALSTPPEIPLAVSIWGNDLTMHAAGSSAMAGWTRRVLARADALMADTARDIRLAQAWGWDAVKPSLVTPGNGGLDLGEIHAARSMPFAADGLEEAFRPDPARPLVINPRGFRTGSVRQDTFFQAAQLVLDRRPEVRFACAAMAGQREALQWVERLGLQKNVTLLPTLPQPDLWRLFARAAVTVSISQHDGTPNSLLEGMALGAFPVAGDIESLREWITPGVNGLLVEPDKPQAAAEAILLALDTPTLRERAAVCNARIVRQRAEVGVVRGKIQALYEELAGPPAS